MSDYPVCAWRIGRSKDGRRIRRIVIRTSSYAAMVQWLRRTARQRHGGNTLWIEEEWRPALARRMQTR